MVGLEQYLTVAALFVIGSLGLFPTKAMGIIGVKPGSRRDMDDHLMAPRIIGAG